MLRLKFQVADAREVQAVLCGLVAQNLVQMRRGAFPALYRSGIRYEREPIGQENWLSARDLLRKKRGDCEDLAAYRVAELRTSGEDPRAQAVVRTVRPGLMHVVVQRGDGGIEDPSRRLGMTGDG